MKRVLCVWLPDFPIQRLHAELPETKSAAVVLYAESGNRAQVVIVSSEARRHGIRAEMSLSEAQALHDGATFLPHDADADIQALLMLATALATPSLGPSQVQPRRSPSASPSTSVHRGTRLQDLAPPSP